MYDYDGYIIKWEKKLHTRFANHKIELLYDKENVKNRFDVFYKCEKILMEVFEYLCKTEKEVHLYLRIHFFREWIVIRIAGNKRLSQDAKKRIKKVSQNGLLTIIEWENGYILKLAF